MTNKSLQTLTKQIPRGTIAWILRTILRLPQNWLIVSFLFAFLSLFEIAWTQENGFSVDFRVRNTTVLFLVAVWLPSLLRIFALFGGVISTPAGELSSPGLEQLLFLVDAETKDEAIGALKVVLEEAEENTGSGVVREAHQKLGEEYVDVVNDEQARWELSQLAQRYQQLRESPSGTKRNFFMEAIAGAMRAIAPKAGFTEAEITAHLHSQHQGERLAALSCLQTAEKPEHFAEVLAAIAQPQSAFEQTQALKVIEKILPQLNPTQKTRLEQVLLAQRDFDLEKQQWIKPGSERWVISEILLAKLANQ